MSQPRVEIRYRTLDEIWRETVQEGALAYRQTYIRLQVSIPHQESLEIRVPVNDTLRDEDIRSLVANAENYLGFLTQAEMILRKEGRWNGA